MARRQVRHEGGRYSKQSTTWYDTDEYKEALAQADAEYAAQMAQRDIREEEEGSASSLVSS